jgi:hypothetical protein
MEFVRKVVETGLGAMDVMVLAGNAHDASRNRLGYRNPSKPPFWRTTLGVETLAIGGSYQEQPMLRSEVSSNSLQRLLTRSGLEANRWFESMEPWQPPGPRRFYPGRTL